MSAKSSRPTMFAAPPTHSIASLNLVAMVVHSIAPIQSNYPTVPPVTTVASAKLVSAIPLVQPVTPTVNVTMPVESAASNYYLAAMSPLAANAKLQTFSCPMDLLASTMRPRPVSARRAGAKSSKVETISLTAPFPNRLPVICPAANLGLRISTFSFWVCKPLFCLSSLTFPPVSSAGRYCNNLHRGNILFPLWLESLQFCSIRDCTIRHSS